MFLLWDAIVNKLKVNADIQTVLGATPRIRRQDNRTKVDVPKGQKGTANKLNGIFFSEEYSRNRAGHDTNTIEDTDVEFIFSHTDMIKCSIMTQAFKDYWLDCTKHKAYRYFDPTDDKILCHDSDITVDWGIKLDNDLKAYESRVIVGIRWSFK